MLQLIIIGMLLIELVLYVALAGYWHRLGVASGWIVTAIVGMALLWRLSHAGVSFVVAAIQRRRDGVDQRWGSARLALVGEFTARLVSFNWAQPFHQLAMADEPCGDGDKPLLLVHGYFSSRGMFVRLRRALRQAGIGPIYTVNLTPLLGSIDAMVPGLHQRIETICRDTGQASIDIVAHSMGGLVVRAYLLQHGPQRVARLVTLGAPHHGTKIAAFGIGRCAQQMRFRSAWIATLQDAEARDSRGRPPTRSIYTLNDDLAYPPESSRLDWADNVPVSAVGHVGLLYTADVAVRVVDFLKVKA